MILDTSALVAILYREPEAATFAQAIHDADACRISLASYVQLSMVIERQLGPEGMRPTEAFFRRAGITLDPVTLDHADLARHAFLDFGQGSHHAGGPCGHVFFYHQANATHEPPLL